jgi:hypothetical protein
MGQENGYKRKQDCQSGKTVFMGVLQKKLKYILEILINVKGGRVKWGARKVYHGRRVGQAWSKRYMGDKNLLSLPGIEPRHLGRPARGLVAISTELSRLSELRSVKIVRR